MFYQGCARNALRTVRFLHVQSVFTCFGKWSPDFWCIFQTVCMYSRYHSSQEIIDSLEVARVLDFAMTRIQGYCEVANTTKH